MLTNNANRTTQSSILSHLRESTTPHSVPSNIISPSLLDAWTPEPTAKLPPRKTASTDRESSLPYGRVPQQGKLFSTAGASPQRRQPSDALEAGPNHASPPISPRSAFRQPVYRGNEYQSFGAQLGSSPTTNRPRSMHSQTSPSAPLPHHPQAHFYGTPDIDLGMPKQGAAHRTLREGFFCSFDGLSSSTQSGDIEDVLLVGQGHALEIFRVQENGFDRIGRLEDLRGAVIGAKIIPYQIIERQQLVAVIIHGPFVPLGTNSAAGAEGGDNDGFSPSSSMLQALHTVDNNHYQTTIEVYDFTEGKHIATLFQSPKVAAEIERYDGEARNPSPVGNMKVQAKGRFIVVSSGTSGEVFVFEITRTSEADQYRAFECIGKVWTSTRSTEAMDTSRSSSESGGVALHDEALDLRPIEDTILSPSPRWLAYVPPASSAQASIHGKVTPGLSGRKAPGISSHTSPAQPQVTCSVNHSEEESFLNKVARDAAQEVVKGARWIGTQGLQAWTHYWRPPGQGQAQYAGSPPYNDSVATMTQPTFPPTHAQERPATRAKNEPTLIAILDLERLSQSQHCKEDIALQPAAVFSMPKGCSLLSFSPAGLKLLTASTKGDVQQVWDLMRMIHGETGQMGDVEKARQGPSIREVARFTRVTEARIIDIVWKEPRGEKVVIISDRGTAHIYNLPSSAFQWPPPRRAFRKASSTTQQSRSETQTAKSQTSISNDKASSSVLDLFSGKTQPFLATVRGVSPRVGSVLPRYGGLTSTAGAGAKGSKAVAAGINRSFSAAASGTVNTIWHLGENRLSLPGTSRVTGPGRGRWLEGRSHSLLAVTGGGLLRIHSIQQSKNPKAGKRRPSVHSGRPTEFKIPIEISYCPVPGQLAGASPSSGSFWLSTNPTPISRDARKETHPLSYAELETHAPFQPCHTDRRVNFFVYEDENNGLNAYHKHDITNWCFGEEIAISKVSSGSTIHVDEMPDASQIGLAQMENIISVEGNEDEGQQIVVTTRRRKRNKKGEGTIIDEDGEFFEDDCEIVDFAEDRI